MRKLIKVNIESIISFDLLNPINSFVYVGGSDVFAQSKNKFSLINIKRILFLFLRDFRG
jgi:hypothetical protein